MKHRTAETTMKHIIDDAIAYAHARGLTVYPTDLDEPEDSECCCLVGALSRQHGGYNNWPSYGGHAEARLAAILNIDPKALEALARGFDGRSLPGWDIRFSEAYELGQQYRERLV